MWQATMLLMLFLFFYKTHIASITEELQALLSNKIGGSFAPFFLLRRDTPALCACVVTSFAKKECLSCIYASKKRVSASEAFQRYG